MDILTEKIEIKDEPNLDCYEPEDWTTSKPIEKLLKIEAVDEELVKKIKSDRIYKVCDFVLVNKHELHIHMMIQSNKCFICKHSIKNRNQFMGHVRKQMKPFQCADCNRTFPSPRSTRLHQKIYGDNGPYKCTEYGKAFK